jgi:hypothetical protein
MDGGELLEIDPGVMPIPNPFYDAADLYLRLLRALPLSFQAPSFRRYSRGGGHDCLGSGLRRSAMAPLGLITMGNERGSVAQRRLKSSAFLDANSSSVRMFFWRSSATRSIVLTMSSTAGRAAAGGAVGAARVSD